jgi:hypothetical protein
VERAFVARSGLRQAFGRFYTDSAGAFYLLQYQFGLPEGAPDIFTFTPCPPLDSATFEALSWCYWKDRNGVYCDLSGVLPQGEIRRVAGASPRTFRPLGCRTLAADGPRVFLNGRCLPGLTRRGLRVYTAGGECYDNVFGDIYLVGPTAVYEENQRVPGQTARTFRVPAGYSLVYPN